MKELISIPSNISFGDWIKQNRNQNSNIISVEETYVDYCMEREIGKLLMEQKMILLI